MGVYKMRCCICNGKDDKTNMIKGMPDFRGIRTVLNFFSVGLIPEKYHYFHKPCMESVICEPTVFTSEEVERALECYDFMESEKKAVLRKLERCEREAKVLKSRITLAQGTLRCLK